MTWTHVLNVLLTPEVLATLLTIIIALLVKSKILTEQDIAKAKNMVEKGHELWEITDQTRLKIPEVAKIVAESKGASPATDTTKKRVSRAARTLLRGWLKF